MPTYLQLVRKLKRNFVTGSLVIVLGVGCLLMYTSLGLSRQEAWTLGAILLVSLCVMMTAEWIALLRHLRPIRSLLEMNAPTPAHWREVYLYSHRLPIKAVQRVLGPHYFGLAIPSAGLAALAICSGLLDLPYGILAVATAATLMLAALHAMVEFFLTVQTVKPLLSYLRLEADARFGTEVSLEGRVLVSIRRKFRWGAFLIGAFPLLVFSLAGQVRFADSFGSDAEYWQWNAIVLVLGLGTAALGAWLLSRDVEEPIRELQEKMGKVRDGSLDVFAADLYSDEFSRLMAGFNHMVESLKSRDRLNNQLIQSYISTLAAALDARDPYTAGHSVRVASYAVEIGWLAGLSLQELEVVKKSALLHDIGKIGVRDDVLLKNGKLTEEEFDQIKQHPVMGENILKQIEPAEALAELLPGVRTHHERYDGKGYPDGLAGDHIPLLGRILAIADAYDAMTSDRPYRKGMEPERALQILREGSGTQWDPLLAIPFVREMTAREKERRAAGELSAGEALEA